MEKQTIQFNGQEWEEITRREWKEIESGKSIRIYTDDSFEAHYYRLIPKPEVFPKIFGGKYVVNKIGEIMTNRAEPIALNDEQILNLKLALAESERIRGKI